MKNKKAFTLVELIVVITILSILATIWFIWYSSYLGSSRDTNRVSQLKNISQALEIYSAKKSLPLPEDNVEVKTWTWILENTIAYQGYVWKNIIEQINYSTEGIDPQSWDYFSYYLTKDKKYFQLMAFLEDWTELQNKSAFNISRSYADYTDKFPTVYWKKLWILTDIDNTPIQEIASIKTAWFLNVSTTTEIYKARFKDNSYLEWTGSYLWWFLSLISRKESIISNDFNWIAYLNFDNWIKDVFWNYNIDNIWNLKTIKTDLDKWLYCNWSWRLIVWSWSTDILWWRNEFTVYISYKVEKWDNSSYNIALASWWTSWWYNIKNQHNFTDINNPKFWINTQTLDDWTSIWLWTNNILKYYGYNNILFTAKDWKWLVVRNRKIVWEWNITWKIREDDWRWIWICSRSSWGYELKWIIDKVYISKAWINKNWIDAFYALLRIWERY